MDKKELLKQHPDLVRDVVFDYINTEKYYIKKSWDDFVKSKTKEDWTILSFTANTGVNIIYRLDEYRNLYFVNNYYLGSSLEVLINNKYYNIHSVRRESDSEIFTVGDNIKELGDRILKITSFKLENNNSIRAFHSENKYGLWLDHITKSKQKLFTTEDGVDVYDKNDKLFEVILNNYHLNENIPLLACNDFFDKRKDGFPSKVFSTKEKAVEYIIMNKPCLSINELKNKFEGLTTNWKFEEMKNLVKNKLKLNE